MANLFVLCKEHSWGLVHAIPPGITGVAQGDNTFTLLFINDGPLIFVSGPEVAAGTFQILGIGTVNVLISGLTGSSRSVSGPGAVIVNNDDSDSVSPYTVDNGVLDLNITTSTPETLITVS